MTRDETLTAEEVEGKSKKRKAELKTQIKCCENCKKFVLGKICKTPCIKYDKWEMKENEQ